MIRLLLIIGLIISIVFDAVQLWLAEPNWVLTGMSSMVLLISVIGLGVTLSGGEEPLELRWAVLYTFPMALQLLASVAARDELVNKKLTELQIDFTVPQILPGSRQDYVDAFWAHVASLSIPAMTVVAGMLVVWGCQWWRARR